MDKNIEEIVNYLNIREKKEQLLRSRDKILKLKSKMSQLTFNRDVALFAYLSDEFDYLISEKSSEETREKIIEQINEISYKMYLLLNNQEVKEYNDLRNEYRRLLFDNDYYLTINISLREALSEYRLPEIYIANLNIVNREPMSNNEHGIIVEPLYDIKSSRKLRHFYNRTSLKYLEELSNDYSYGLDGKRIGCVKILEIKND